MYYYHPFYYSSLGKNNPSYYNSSLVDTPFITQTNYYPNIPASNDVMQNQRMTNFYNHQGIYYTPQQITHHPYRQDPRRVEVYVEGIYCQTSGVGEGNELEIYGFLNVDVEQVFNKNENEAVDIAQGTLYPIGRRLILYKKPGDTVDVYGRLYEDDAIDDIMGYSIKSIPFNEIGNTARRYYLTFKETDQLVYVVFTVNFID